jgi:hypothetical protein
MPRSFLAFWLLLFCSFVQVGAAPTVTVLDPPADSVVPAFTTLTVTFNEQVSGVDANDLLINNESANEVADIGPAQIPAVPAGRMFRFTFTQPPAGPVSVSWDFDHTIAGIGTGAFVPGPAYNFTLTDTIAPTIAATIPANGSTVSGLTVASVTFSEPVVGVDAADLLRNGVAAASVTGSGSGPYDFTYGATEVGAAAFTWAGGHGIADTAPIPNAFAGAGWSATVIATPLPALTINEFVAANASGLADENTSAEDWIEIHNPGATTVSLAGWSLTDDEAIPNKWVFPNWTLGAGRYLIVFASSKDRRPAQAVAGQDNTGTLAQPRLHTNFTLSPSGSYLALTTPNGPTTVSSSFNYPEQRYNHSYGPQTGGALRYFAAPTPGAANGLSALTSICAIPTASVQRGYFKEPFSLVLSTPEASGTIRYTLDGSDPTAVNGANYTGPLTVSATTILRMATFSTAKVPSTTVTQTYIFLDQVLAQPSPPYFTPATPGNPQPPSVGGVPLPIAWGTRNLGSGQFPGQITNLAANQVPADYGMDPEILNDPVKYDNNGVVNNVTGKTNLQRINEGFRELPLLSVVLKTDDMFGASGLYPNSIQKGTGFEKLCSVELLMPDGTTGFASTCGIRIHGNASRNPENCPKHGFKLNFKGTFGASSLQAKLFPESPVEEFDDIILRGDFNSSWLHHDAGNQRPKGTRLRDAFSKDTFRAMGREAGHHRYVHLFINGVYWGTYDPTEQENNGFAAAYFGGSKDDYDVIEQGALKSGTSTAYNAMIAIASPIDNSKYEQMKGLLDVPEFADYMLLHFYLGHEDWGGDINKNWYAVRNNKKNGKFNYLPWDMENLLWSEGADRTGVTAPASGLHPKLVTNPQYLLDFADRVHKAMVAPDGALLPAANIARWNKWRSVMTNAIACESARWGDYRRDVHQFQPGGPPANYPLYTWNGHWITENNRLTNIYFPVRTNNVLAQLRTRSLYPALNAAEVRNFASNVLLGSQTVAAGTQVKFTLLSPAPAGTTSAGTIYYTTDGSDPRVTYSGAIGATATAYVLNTPIAINATTVFKVRVLNGAIWSALNECTLRVGGPDTGVRITELHYNPSNAHGGSSAEFIELFNTSNQAVDISGWFFDGVDFVVPAGTTIGAGSRLVIANNNAPATFAAQFPGVSVLGYFSGNLSNDGERIALMDGTGKTIVSVNYDDGGLWPTTPDGSGPSLEIIDPHGDPDSHLNWKASAAAKGTPGAPNSAPATFSVRFSEVCAQNLTAANNSGSFQDYVEIENTSGAPVDVSGYSLTTATGSPIYNIPVGTTIPAGEFLVIWIGPNDGSPGLHTGNAPLDSLGGELSLRAAGIRVDAIRYGNQVADYSLSRVAGNWTLATPSAGAANAAATAAPLAGNVVFNEWLADSPGEPDWIEFHNKHATLPVDLTGAFVQTSTQSFRIVTPTFLGPQQSVRLYCSEDAGLLNLDFNLPAEGTTLTLLNSSGASVDVATFGQQTSGVSQGRLPDGTGPVVSFNGSASPGATNYIIPNTGPKLNEVLVLNTSDSAPWGNHPSWIEVVNSDGTPLDLTGMRLNRHGTVWNFPAGSSIAAGGTLVIWCDASRPASTVVEPDLNAGFGLLAAGDSLTIQNALGQNVSLLAWGPQISNRSIGVSGGDWQLLETPTRGAANSAPAALGSVDALRINEWSNRTSDWFELYNPNSLPVALSGLFLSDDAGEAERGKYQIPALSFVGARSWRSFDASNSPSLGPTFVSFSLDDAGEYLRLSKNDGAFTQIDAVSFGPQASGVTSGRLGDGTPTFLVGLVPTPNSANLIQFASWAVQNGILGNDPTGDADKDGISNIQEFLHQLSPTQSDQGASRFEALPRAGFENIAGVDYITVVHRLGAGSSLSVFEYQLSDDLINWNPTIPAASEVIAVDPTNGAQTVKLRFAVAPGEEKMFLRLLLVP